MYSKTIGLIFSSVVLLTVLLWGLYYSGYAPAFLLVGGKVESGQDKIMQNVLNANEPNIEAVIAKWYSPLTQIKIGHVDLFASIADTAAEREQGLSGTPYLPDGVVKLFVFEDSGYWSFWMKDMNYPIDILWLDENGQVVYIVESASPDSYPDTNFVPPIPTKYVIETKAGFAKENDIVPGTIAGILPDSL